MLATQQEKSENYNMSSDTSFYRAFEDKYRGSRELIKDRLEIYMPFVAELKQTHPELYAIDLGCGRGEWLELLSSIECNAYGVDLDEGMLQACKERSLNVKHADAIKTLQEAADNSLSLVSGFHIVEHLPFDVLKTLVEETLRALAPGGLLILETPNPQNLRVASENFYLDPTHIKPIPMQLLAFLPEYYGYKRTKIMGLQESKELKDLNKITLTHVVNGASPDYAIIAQKSASYEIIQRFDTLFAQQYGLALDDLMMKLDIRFLESEQRAIQADTKANQAIQSANQAIQSADEAWRRYYEIEQSKSWRLTKPLRLTSNYIHWFVRGAYHWLTFSPSSRPRRVSISSLIWLRRKISQYPKVKNITSRLLNLLPEQIKHALITNTSAQEHNNQAHYVKSNTRDDIPKTSLLSARSMAILNELMDEYKN